MTHDDDFDSDFWMGLSPASRPDALRPRLEQPNVQANLDAVNVALEDYKLHQRIAAFLNDAEPLIEQRLPHTNTAVSQAILGNVYPDDPDAFLADLQKAGLKDTKGKLDAVAHHIDRMILKTVGDFVEDVVNFGSTTPKSYHTRRFYDGMVWAAPVLGKLLSDNGEHRLAGLAKIIPIQDLLRARLPGVGETFLSQIHKAVARTIADMPEDRSRSFHAELHGLIYSGTETEKIGVAKKYIDMEIARAVRTAIEYIDVFGPEAHSDSRLYEEMIAGAPTLREVLIANTMMSGVSILRKLVDRKREEDRTETDELSGAPPQTKDDPPRKRAATHSPASRERKRSMPLAR